MTKTRHLQRNPAQLSSYQAAKFETGTGLQIGSAYTLNGIGAALIEETPSEIVVPATEETILIAALSGRAEQRTDLLGRKVQQPFPRNSVIVIPAGLATWWSAPSAGMTQIHIHVAPAFLQRIEEGRLANLDQPRLGYEDAALAQIGGAIEAALSSYEGTGLELYLEHLLLAYVIRTFSGPRAGDAPRGGGLAPWAERQCIAYMRENLAREVQLSDLAQIAGLSLHHFARMFKQNTGKSPHAFLMAARMEKARELLTHSTLPVSEVAALVGYCAPSTFARLFRAEIGESPLRYRQLTRPLAANHAKGDSE
jgi:AraC-like DNA-binding protein